jgi:internalin A
MEQVEFPRFATKFSTDALASRKTLPPDLQSELLDIIDILAQDPGATPHRVRTLSRDGKVHLYTHPKPPVEVTYEIDDRDETLYFLHFAAHSLVVSNPLFISYSHEDVEWLAKLKPWLKPLEQRDLIKIWDDKEIRAGAQWEKEIEKSLLSAKAALLLVTQNFLASEFIREKELPRLLQGAEERGVSILWVAVSESMYEETELAKYQALTDPSEPLDGLSVPRQNKALKSICNEIKMAIETT